MTTPEDFAKICRACMGKKGDMRPLYGSCLDTMLVMVADVQVEPNDGLPETMCVQCVLQVSRAFNFKQTVERSDISLRKIYLDNLAKSCIMTNSVVTPIEVTDVKDGIILQQETQAQENVVFQHPTVHEEVDDKCLLIVQQQLPLLNESDTHMLGLAENETDGMAGGEPSLGVHEDLMAIEQKMEMALNDRTDDIIQMVSTLPMGENDDIINDAFDTFSSDACGADNTDAETLLVTVDSSLFDALQGPSHATNIELKYGCAECGLNFSRLDELNDHQTNHHTEDDAATIACDESSLGEGRNYKLPNLQCHVCQKVFSETKILRRHLKTHSTHKPHVCDVCNMTFAESSNLKKHKKKHTGELRNIVGKPNLCSVCGKRFKWASSLSKHMKHHTKHKINNCPYCPKYYVEARSLNIHIRSHTGEKPFVCKVCQKGFTQMGNLDKHMRVHTGEKPFLCPMCGKGFSQSGYVSIHIRTHTGEKPYKCQDCGKGFTGSNTLAIHRRTHTGERPYPCQMCDKMFARQETAIIHQRTHTGEKPHVCPICNRGFTSSGHLTGHMRSHMDNKPHECVVCRKLFAGINSLKAHLKAHALSDDKVYACAFCDEKFSELCVLEEHELEHDMAVDSALLHSNINVIQIMDTTNIIPDEVLASDALC